MKIYKDYPNIINAKLLMALGFQPVDLAEINTGSKKDLVLMLRDLSPTAEIKMAMFQLNTPNTSKNAVYSAHETLKTVSKLVKSQSATNLSTQEQSKIDKLNALLKACSFGEREEYSVIEEKLSSGMYVEHVGNVLDGLKKHNLANVQRIKSATALGKLYNDFKMINSVGAEDSKNYMTMINALIESPEPKANKQSSLEDGGLQR